MLSPVQYSLVQFLHQASNIRILKDKPEDNRRRFIQMLTNPIYFHPNPCHEVQYLNLKFYDTNPFIIGAELSLTELSKTQQEARDKVRQFITAAEGKLHTSGWVINWLNNPPKKVKPQADTDHWQIKFGFTGPAVCTGGEPSTTSGRMTIDRRDRPWTRRASESANGCSGFVQGEKLEIRDNQNKILYPV
ncbi:hypothetical protein C8J55DRAFT_546512 [Lentinula edodes]|uniref:Uncharacterized protein n=1 Tax=Lentinula lateritia TaxID=40482 RepID=A0A9W9AZR8_9AGAR|nr:hypothetical protein C8J55DRAFT_546512 [Lentinula edodes]